ncbi:ImmA/IrrE family metallo-endopeptidase [Atopococcus tabaci]|uniref:ImmA/IrrE family metallo-endopeptidase n=1 Tax=Atopococcus tabaci TaxID=269774 RepID=UPI002409110D|nr:ImmA/IrrE family metallo-endopeptidase [Atopococcus tabaci]
MLDKVKVGALDYDVFIQEHFTSHDDDRNLWGYCDYEKQEIYVRESLKETKREQVFVHEMLHAMFLAAGYMQHEEDMVQRLGQVMHQVLRENDFSWLRPKGTETTHIYLDGEEVEKMTH